MIIYIYIYINTKVSCWGGKTRKSETRGRNKMTEIDMYVENLGLLVRPYKVKVLALVRHLDQYNGEDRV